MHYVFIYSYSISEIEPWIVTNKSDILQHNALLTQLILGEINKRKRRISWVAGRLRSTRCTALRSSSGSCSPDWPSELENVSTYNISPRWKASGKCSSFNSMTTFVRWIHGDGDGHQTSFSPKSKRYSIVTGLEPAIPRSEVWCLIH